MDHFQKYITQVRSRLFAVLIIDNLLVIINWWIGEHIFNFNADQLLLMLIVVSLISLTVLPWISTRLVTEPTRLLWQAILHIAPDAANTPAPDIRRLRIGRDMVVNLVGHVYQLASVAQGADHADKKPASGLKHNFVASNLPLPLMILDKNQTILFANKAMCDYIHRTSAETIGQNVYSVLDLSFVSNETLDRWLETSRANAAVNVKTWERVRLQLPTDKATKQFDLAAYYNKNNPDGFEAMLVFFDHTEAYSQDDQALGFVALAVHELRTPITLLRGYIEALEEDLDGKLDDETRGFIHKMKASAQGLTTFINNMLNVARVEGDQLVLNLHEDSWAGIVQTAVNDLSLRARVQGVEIQVEVADKLPPVGVDRVSIYEVLCNLIDNAIKYTPAGADKKVVVKSYLNSEGLVETTVQDSGAGIPASVLPNLFEKFYRSHRSRNQVGGTGLGLYLAKAIVGAHGGHIWVNSREGQGSLFGFSVMPYAKLADAQKNGDNNDITRGAHGWIKNHSLYSR